MADIAELVIKVDATDPESAQKVLDRLAASGDKAAGSADAMEASFSRAMRVLGPSAMGAVMAVAIKNAIDLQDQYVRLSEVAGTTASRMSAFSLSAKLSGTSMEAVAQSVARLGKAIGEARLGDVQKGGIFKALGIDVNDGRDAAEVFVDVSRAVMSMKDQNVAGAVSAQLLSRGFAEMRPLMKEIVEQGTLVATVTDEQAQKAKEFNDRITALNHNYEVQRLKLANDLMPVLSEFLTIWEQLNEQYQLSETASGTIVTIFQTIAVVASDVAFVFKMVGGELGVIAAQIAALVSSPPGEAFKRFSIIGEEWKRDAEQARKDLDDFQARVMNLGKVTQEAGKPAGSPTGGMSNTGGAEARIKAMIEFNRTYEQQLASTRGFYDQYAAAIKIGQEVAEQQRKAGVLSEEQLIIRQSELEQARLQMLKQSLEREAELHAEKEDFGKKEEALQKAAQIDSAIVANQVITNARVSSLREESRVEYLRDLAQRANDIQQSNMTELQLLEGKLTAEQNIIDAAAREGLISDEVWQAQSAMLFSKYEKEKTRLHDEEIKQRYNIAKVHRELDASSAGDFFNIMSGMMSHHSRKAFEIGKAAAISKTIIDTYQAAQGAYAALSSIPIVGPALGAAAAAAAIVAGIARVNQIRSTQFGAGGSPGGSGVGTFGVSPQTGLPTAPPPPLVNAAGGGTTIIVQGNVMTEDFVRDTLAPIIRDQVSNNDLILIAAGSRNAAEIVESQT